MPSHHEISLGGLYYLSPLGGKYKGRLRITPSTFLFEADFDETFSVIYHSRIHLNKGKKVFTLSKEEISSVEFKRSFFKQKMILSQNGRSHIFVGFLLPKTKIFNAFKDDQNE